jgi:hypothetical protein
LDSWNVAGQEDEVPDHLLGDSLSTGDRVVLLDERLATVTNKCKVGYSSTLLHALYLRMGFESTVGKSRKWKCRIFVGAGLIMEAAGA